MSPADDNKDSKGLVWLKAIGITLGRLESYMRQIFIQGYQIMATLDDIKAKVDAEGTVQASVVTLLTSLNAQLKSALASGDTTKLQAISDELDAQTATLAAAVVANTPAQTVVIPSNPASVPTTTPAVLVTPPDPSTANQTADTAATTTTSTTPAVVTKSVPPTTT